MQAWLEQHLTAWVFLTLAIAATLLLLLATGMSWRARTPWPAQAIALWASLAAGAWAGLVIRNDWNWPAMHALMTAVGVSLTAAGCLLVIPHLWRRLAQQRQAARAQAAVGRIGKIYRTLEAQTDAGMVEVEGLGRFTARCDTPGGIDAFTSVQIIQADAQGRLLVTPAPPTPAS